MPEDETMWEVWVKYDPPKGKWFLSMKFQDFKEAKSYYNECVNSDGIEVRMIRAELHRAIVIEDLKGNVYAD